MAKANSQVATLDDDTPVAAAEAKASEAPIVVGKNHDSSLSGERRTVTIHPTDSDGGSDAVFVSHNGYAYQIPRGTPQSLPVEVLQIIKDAKTTIYQAMPGGQVGERTVQRFAFSVE
jgi:hypothetical protein